MDFGNLISGAGNTGAMPGGEVEALRKALTAGYGTDVSTLTGGAALRIQSLDRTMQSTIQENKHFRLFNRLQKPNAGATVDEWTEQNSVGGFLGGTSNSETGNIADSTGSYNRRVGLVKYLMTRRQVSLVQTLQGAIADSEAVEYSNGALQLLTDAEFFCFEGDSSVVATEFDGIPAQLISGVNSGQVDPSNVIDARAASLNSVILINKGAAQIAKYGNFGVPTDLFCSLQTQADFDNGLDPAFRVPLTDVPGGGVSIGAPVVGIRTSHGNIANQPDVFIRDQDMMVPFEVTYAAVAVANNAYQPASLTAAGVGGDASSQWTAPQAGNYYYAVAGVTAAGQSQAVVSSQATVAAGGKVTVTITRSTSATETGYVLYRGRLNGTNALSDLRQIARVPYSGSATTVYTDNNQNIPGTTSAFILNMTSGATAITWRQLLPMIKFPLYPTQSAVIPWAQLLFGYLRISKRRHHVVIRNILPKQSTWLPFG